MLTTETQYKQQHTTEIKGPHNRYAAMTKQTFTKTQGDACGV